MRFQILLGSVSVLAAVAAAGQARAQTTATAAPAGQEAQPAGDPSQPPEEDVYSANQEILVTAQRRTENLQDVPIAISAISGEQLEARGITEALDVIQFVPNMFGSNNTGIGSANAYYLRGLGNTETIATFDPPVGTYVDDIYLSRQNANNLSFFDVERVEVLRGPQGTLFGRNTTGGAINVILRQPGDTFGGFAEAGYGRFDTYMARASIDVPLADTLAIKVSGYFQDSEGYVQNITTGDRLNDDDGWGVRVAARGELTPDIVWNGSYTRIVSEAENLLDFLCNPAAPTQCDGRFASTGLREGRRLASSPYTGLLTGFPFTPASVSRDKAFFGLGNYAAQDLLTSRFEIGLTGDLTLGLITGFVNLTQEFALDFADGRALPSLQVPGPPVRGFARGGFVIINDGEHEQFSQEIKLNGSLFGGAVDFVGGFFYLDEQNDTDFADVFSIFTGAPGGLGLLLADRRLVNSTEALAAYLQADFNVTPELTLTAGIRYTDESKTLSFSDNRARCQVTRQPAFCLSDPNLRAANGVAIPLTQSAQVWTPRFAVNYQPGNDLLFYASATRGFKSGGWNARSTAPSQVLPFGPETVWSYEAGAKIDLFDRLLRTNIAIYRADVSDLQTPSALVGPTGAITFLTRNFADYRNQGVELEVSLFPLEGLNLFANVGYQDDEYLIDPNAPATDLFGVTSVAAQQAACRAQRAAGQIPGASNTAPPGRPPNNAPSCGTGIITATGDIADPVRTPEWSLALGATYRAPIGTGGIHLIPSVNATYRSEYEVQTSNLTFYTGSITGSNGTFPANPFEGEFITGSRAEAYWLVNASLALQGADDRWQISVECQNCFDEVYLQSSLANYSYFSEPMTWMVRGRVRF